MKQYFLWPILIFLISCSNFNFTSKKIQRIPAQNSPEIIFYPGTFDPFHATHFEEATRILTQHPSSKLVILPIEEAYYYAPKHFARIFEYQQSQKLIELAFEGNTQVIVSDELRSINQNIFQTLTELGQKYKKKDVAFLVGADVLDLWKDIPNFEELTKHVRLIVNKDPKNADHFDRLWKQFENHPRIEFVDYQVQGLRSKEIKLKLVQDIDDFSYLPEKIATHFKNNPQILDRSLEDLNRRLTLLLDTDFQKEILPLLEESKLSIAILDLIKKNNKIRNLFYQCRPNDPLSISWLVREIQMNLKSEIDIKANPYLFEKMYKLFNEGALSNYYSSPIVRRNIEMYRVLTDRLSKGANQAYQGLLSRTINSLGRHVWSIGQYFFHQSSSLKKALFDIPIDPRLLSLNHGISTGDLEVTVYRGVRAHENMEKLLTIWQEEGFLSKVALDTRKKGVSTEDAVKESQKYLQTKGLQKSLVDHIVGDWSIEAPFISTSFDKLTAAKYAGKGGYVFTMKVKLSQGYFLNDLAYWQSTPWQKTGNPVEYLHEFVIPHHIKPEMVVATELILEDPPAVAVKASTKTISKILKAVPWKIMYGVKSCTNIFRKVNAPRPDLIPLD